MPDIVSRIKLEAQGADAAAREIRKLQQAYEDTAKAASSIPGIGGPTESQDPFIKSETPLNIQQLSYSDKLQTGIDYSQSVKEREEGNLSFNRDLREDTPAGQIGIPGSFSGSVNQQPSDISQIPEDPQSKKEENTYYNNKFILSESPEIGQPGIGDAGREEGALNTKEFPTGQKLDTIESLSPGQALNGLDSMVGSLVSEITSAIKSVGAQEASSNPFTSATNAPDAFEQSEISSGRPIQKGEYSMSGRREEETTFNNTYNQLLKAGGSTVGQGFGTAEALAEGRGGQAIGGLAGLAGSLLTGPAGIAAAIVGAGAMGVQRMADEAFGRLEQTFGTGMSQRLGLSSMDTQKEMIGFSRMGIPQGMVQSFFNAASNAGVDFNRESTQKAVNASMVAANALGVDPSVLASLVGTLNKANVNASNVAGIGTFSMGRGSFGQAGVGTYLQSLNAMLESANVKGIESYTDTALRAASEMAGLKAFGGFSTTGAAGFTQQLQTRGISAAGLQSPEDIIAFQAMREPGVSVTDTLIRMEENPFETNQQVFEYLQRTSGGDEDLLRLKLQKYLGAGTSMSTVDKYIKQQKEIQAMESAGMSQTEIMQNLGYDENITQDWTGMVQDEKGNITSSLSETRIYQAKQNDMLKNFQNQMLELTTTATGTLINMFGKIPGFNPMGMTKAGYDEEAVINEKVQNIDAMTIQDVSNLTVLLANETDTQREMEKTASLMENPNFAESYSTALTIKQNPELFEQLDTLFEKGEGSSVWDYFKQNMTSGEDTLSSGGVGGWGVLFQTIESSLVNEIRRDVGNTGPLGNVKENKDVLNRLSLALISSFSGMPSSQTFEMFQKQLELLEKLIAEQGIVYTDGDWNYRGN